VPGRDSKLLLKLLQLDLEAHPPSLPVIAVCMTVIPAKARSRQLGLFLPLSPDPERLEITLAKIQSIVGETRVGAPVLLDTDSPISFQQSRFVLPETKEKRSVVQKQTTAAMRIYPRRFLQSLSFRKENRLLSVAKESDARFSRLLDRGEEKAVGGLKPRGHAMNGTSKCGRCVRSSTRIQGEKRRRDCAVPCLQGLARKTLVRRRNLRLKYVELHASSAFSFLESASRPEDLISRAKELELPAIALVDRDAVYGCPRFHMAAKTVGVQAHVGAEISVEGFGNSAGLPAWMPNSASSRPVRLPLLVENRAGYQNLCRLMTRYKLREKEKGTGTATLDEIAEHSEGLVCLTGGEEVVLAASLSNQGYDEARKNIETLTTIFGRKNVYVELQRHCDVVEERRNQAAVRLAETLGLPLLATNGVRYAAAAERELLDVFTCIRNHQKLETAGRLLERNDERHLRSTKEMVQLLSDLPEAIHNTSELSARLEYTLADLGYEFPRYPVPTGETMDSFLRKRTEEGFQNRYAVKQDNDLFERAKRQVQRELALIEELHLAGYFLIVWDIIRFCREQKILVQGRGSAANSVVCYSLGITAVDPVGMELLFERFLSKERGEWSDIDMDLPSRDQREKAIQYVYQRYGQLGAAMTANVITYRDRSAAREVGKALGFDQATLDQLSSVVNSGEWRGPSDNFGNHFQQVGFDLNHPRVRKYWELCERIQDLPRHLGQHSGGMVVCQGQLDSVVPLEPTTMPGRVVVQWDKDDCADMGIIKIDLLGLGMMAVLEDCLELIPKHYSKPVDLAQLPPDDPPVYETLECFKLKAVRRWLRCRAMLRLSFTIWSYRWRSFGLVQSWER